MHLRRALLTLPLLLLGCGTSAATGPGDAGDQDGTMAPPVGDAGTESSRIDAGTDSVIGADSSVPDSSTADAGTDAGSTDSSAESGTDSAAGEAGAEAGPPQVGASVLMYHNHINRDGFFIDPLITTATAPTFALDTSFVAPFPDNSTIPDKTWTSPLYVEHGPGGKGTFYVATAGNNLYALDETTGSLAWPVRNFGTPANHTYQGGCGNVQPIGITGTPAIDLATNLIVFDAVSADAGGFIATHTIYGVSILDGSTQWSVDVSTLTDSTGVAFSPQPQNQRGAVLIVNGIAYVVYGGHLGDCGTYHGWVVGVPLSGTGAKAWATQVAGAGIWGPGGAASDGQSIFVTTGNGIGGTNVTWQESEGVFRLDPGPSFTQQSADYFAPTNWFALDEEDLDLSGSGPLVIDAPSMTPSALVMAQGKDGNLYLLQRDNLGGVEADGGVPSIGILQVMSGAISNGGASATLGSGSTSTTYVVVRPNGGAGFGCPNGTSGDLVAVKLDPTAPQKMSVAWCALSGGQGSPIITTSDGTNDPLVWTFAAEGLNQLRSFSLTTGAPVFAGGTAGTITFPAGASAHHFATILAANGRIIVSADGGLYAFKAAP